MINVLSIINEDVRMFRQSPSLPTGVRNVLLASLEGTQKTGKRRTISRHERETVSGRHP